MNMNYKWIIRTALFVMASVILVSCAQQNRPIGLSAAVAENNEGIKVIGVQQDTPADILGLENGDIITEFGNVPLKGVPLHKFVTMIQNYEPDISVPIKITRGHSTWDGKILTGLSEETFTDYFYEKNLLNEAISKNSTDVVEGFILNNPKSLAKRHALKVLVEMGNKRTDRASFYSTLIKKYPETARMIEDKIQISAASPATASVVNASQETVQKAVQDAAISTKNNTPSVLQSVPVAKSTGQGVSVAQVPNTDISAAGNIAPAALSTPATSASYVTTASSIGLKLAFSDNSEGIEIVEVKPDTPADILGLQNGDVILEFGSRFMKGVKPEEFMNILKRYQPDTTAPIKLVRNGSTLNGKILAELSYDTVLEYNNEKAQLQDAIDNESTDEIENFILNNPKSLAKRKAFKALVEMGEKKPDRDGFYDNLINKYPDIAKIIESRTKTQTAAAPEKKSSQPVHAAAAVPQTTNNLPAPKLTSEVISGSAASGVVFDNSPTTATIASSVSVASNTSSFFKGRSYALLIAVQDYLDESVNDLNYPVHDAEALKTVLITHYTFNPENVILLKNPDRDKIIQTLGELRHRLRSGDDNLLIFYAGHGYWDEELKQGFWIPSDASLRNEAKWLSNGTLKDYVRGIKSKHTLVISDACFSGALFKSREAFVQPPKAIQEVYKLPSRKAITSGAMRTVPDKSVFIEYFLKRLKENTEKYIDTQSLFASMKAAVINNSPVNQTPLYGTIQESGDEGGDFLFEKR